MTMGVPSDVDIRSLCSQERKWETERRTLKFSFGSPTISPVFFWKQPWDFHSTPPARDRGPFLSGKNLRGHLLSWGKSSERALCWKEIPEVISFQKRSTRENGTYRIWGLWSSTRQFLIQARAFRFPWGIMDPRITVPISWTSFSDRLPPAARGCEPSVKDPTFTSGCAKVRRLPRLWRVWGSRNFTAGI